MVFMTGDCHGDYSRFSTRRFPEQKEMTKDDYVIVCGDFGYWDDSEEQRCQWDWLSEKPFTTLFVDGNHENFDLLGTLPVKEWHGGKVQFITDSIIHLMRGQVFTIGGMKFFTFGGARSHDIRDGILDPADKDFRKKYKRLRDMGAMFRVNHLSWWKEEMPDEAEMQEGRENLEKHGWKADFIVTHCAPSSVQAMVSMGEYTPDALTDYLEEIHRRCRFREWFFGHYHNDYNVTARDTMLYGQIMRIL